MREKLSVLIPTWNEEINIADCIESVKDLADELLVMDNFSTDRTTEIAKSLKAEVRQQPFQNYSANKNGAIEILQHPWVLILDADERIGPELKKEILRVLEKESGENAFRIPRETYFADRRVRCWSTGSVIRLFRRGKAKYSEDKLVHEELIVSGNVGTLQNPIRHYTFRSFNQYLPKIDSFTTLAAQEAFKKDERARWFHFLIFPPSRFLKTLVFRGGILDGIPGWIIAWLSAYSIFLKYAKLWELQRHE